MDVGDDKTKLGKCTLCARQIVNDSTKFWCKEMKHQFDKYETILWWVSARLRVKTVHSVTLAFSIKHDEIQSSEQRYYTIDEATGRMVVDG